MSPDKEQLRARMMAEAEALIDRLLSDADEKEQLDLSDIEHLARAAGQRMMERLTSALIDTEAQEKSYDCPECGQKTRYKGRRARNLVTETGEVRFERGYYYCPTCRKGVFPPRPTMGSE
jgi:uncharacterized protein with PIN domain